MQRTVFVADYESSHPLAFIQQQRRVRDICGQIENEFGCVRLAWPQGLGKWSSRVLRLRQGFGATLRRPVLTSLGINHSGETTIWRECSVSSVWADGVFIKTSLDRYDVVKAIGRRLVRAVTQRFGLPHVENGISEVAVNFAEVFFLTAGKYRLGTREREKQQEPDVDCCYYTDRADDNLSPG